MGAAMGSEAFKEMSDSLGFSMTYGPAILAPPPEGPPPADAPPPNMCAVLEVKDFDSWYSGFMEHGKSKNVKVTFCGFLKEYNRTCFQNLKFPKFHVPAVQKMFILS